MLGVDDLAGHPWHHYWTGGPESLALMLLPLLGLATFVLAVAMLRSLLSRASALARRHWERSALPVVTRGRLPVRVLASDRERDEATARLSQAVAEGRLSLEEATQRIEAALASRHRHQLARLVSDLPLPAPVATTALDRRTRFHRDLLLFAVCAVLAACVAQMVAGVWAMWPVAVSAWAALALMPRPRIGQG
jgi:uncharacterized membrane protein YoaK (UPF0700 family)